MNEVGSSVEMLIGAGIIVSFFLIVFAILAGVLAVIGNYRLAKREGMEDIAWFVLIPVLSNYVVGKIPERTAPRPVRRYLGIANAVLFVLAFITQVLWVLYLPVYVYTVFLTYKRYSTKYVAMMIVTVLTFFLAYPFFIFAIRNNKVVDRDGSYEFGDPFEDYVDEKSNVKESLYTDKVDLNK